MASWERRQRSAMNSSGAVEPIPARGGGGVLKKTLDRADAIIEALRYFLGRSKPKATKSKSRRASRSSSARPLLIAGDSVGFRRNPQCSDRIGELQPFDGGEAT